jgi:3-hydroxyisobutyrate dehydrogenase-like beta-hydroxyacid dehydrogenase
MAGVATGTGHEWRFLRQRCNRPLLHLIGERIWRMGTQPERANVVKLAGNFMVGAAVEPMAEASAMAWRNDVAPADLLDVLTNRVFTAPAYRRTAR